MIKLIQRQAIILPNNLVSIVRYSLLGLINKICINIIYSEVEHFHSHPWDFISVVLWGGYKEILWKDGRETVLEHRVGSIIKRKHTEFHRVEPLDKKAITLFFRGRQKSSCNYWVKNGKVYSESKFWLSQGYTKDKMRKLFNYMKEYNE